MSVYQISVFLENRAGQLAEITGILADSGVDLRAISIAETVDYGIVRMIVDDTSKAAPALQAHDYVFSMTPVQVVRCTDRPGALARILKLLADAHIDIEYMYSLFTHEERKSYMVFRPSDEKKFIDHLQANGLSLCDKAELGLK